MEMNFLPTSQENQFIKSISKSATLQKLTQCAQDNTRMNLQTRSGQTARNATGTKRALCILIGFPDRPFVKTQGEFNNFMNQSGYNAATAIGSVRDYYLENSYNQLNLNITVVGPYTADHNMACYGENIYNASGRRIRDIRPQDLIKEALLKADPDVNYADFDNDNDGTVDGVHVIYAGYAEAAGGGAETIWPHKWTVSGVSYDGVYHIHSQISPDSQDNNIAHPQKIYPICASATQNPTNTPNSYGNINSGGCPFPGTSNIRSLTFTTTPRLSSWSGASTGKDIQFITEVGSNITFVVNPRISGPSTVCDQATYTIENLPPAPNISYNYSTTLYPNTTYTIGGSSSEADTYTWTIIGDAYFLKDGVQSSYIISPDEYVSFTTGPGSPGMGEILRIRCVARNGCGASGASGASTVEFEFMPRGSAFTLSPNPATDMVTVRLQEGATDKTAKLEADKTASSGMYEIQLWSGLALIRTYKTDLPSYTLPVSDLPRGMYFIRVIKDGKIHTRKLLKN